MGAEEKMLCPGRDIGRLVEGGTGRRPPQDDLNIGERG